LLNLQLLLLLVSLHAGQELLQQSGGTFEGLRSYLRQLAVAAYEQKAAAVDGIEPGLMQEAQKFFVLTQTDNLWKEHLQVRPGLADCLAYEQAGGQR
jgi:preprotein translocase subunit SecA